MLDGRKMPHGSIRPDREQKERPGQPRGTLGQSPKISVSRGPVTNSQAMKVTKWSTYSGDLAVSEQAEQTSGEAGSPRVEPIVPHSSDALIKPVAGSAELPVNAESPPLVPEPSVSGQAPEVSVAQPGAFKPEVSRETVKEAPKVEAPRMPGKVLIMSSADHAWADDEAG